MRDFNSQNFTVFGGAYITESHGASNLAPVEGKTNSMAKIAAVAGLLILGISTATAAKGIYFGGLQPQVSYSTWISSNIAVALY